MDRYKLSLKARQYISYGIIVFLFLILLAGTVKLQIFQHASLFEQSENNRLRVQPLVPRRGLVYDRNGKIIIDNRPSYTVAVVPAEEVKGVTIQNLAELLEMDTLTVRKRIRKNQVSRYQPAPVKRDIPIEIIAILEEQSKRFPGVTYHMEQVRQYESQLYAETVTGYVGEVSEEEIKQSEEFDYRLGSTIGKKGLEKEFDFKLRGREGTQYLEITASGQFIGEYKDKTGDKPVPGENLILSIDNDLQLTCTKTLDTFCCGAIVAMNPRTGEVLAMTSYPGYDPNIFSSVIPDSLWQAILADSIHPLLNRPMNGLYPPGSTVKFVTVGAGLEEGIITANTTFKPCFGGYQFGNRFFRCWNPAGHGSPSAAHAIEMSCDTYMYQLGLKLGIDKLSEYYGKCGFGVSTGIDLPNESPGLNPNSEYYDRRYGSRKWSRGLVLNNAIGQGELLVTPIQLAQFYCGLANNGLVYRPHIVKSRLLPDGKRIDIPPVESFRLPFSDRTMEILLQGLRLVVEGEHGTARSLRNKYYSIGGKTGTAQNPHGDNHSWFAAIAPLENPEIVVVAIVENAGHGSEVAAPLVGEIIKHYLLKEEQNQSVTVIGEEE